MVSDSGIEIILKPAYFKFHYLYIPAALTAFFPPGSPRAKHPIRIEADAGVFTAELQYNSVAHV